MENTVVQDGCRALLAATEPWIKTVSTIEFKGLEKSVFLRAVLTAIVVKQFELVTVILEQSETERGFASVPLLRSMCEELMWIRFLASLDSEDAADMIVEMANVGLDETYKAQEGYVVPNLVFPPAWVAGTKLAAEAARVALRSKFKKLGFSLRSNQYLPSCFKSQSGSIWRLSTNFCITPPLGQFTSACPNFSGGFGEDQESFMFHLITGNAIGLSFPCTGDHGFTA
jgi:hypothetical protein